MLYTANTRSCTFYNKSEHNHLFYLQEASCAYVVLLMAVYWVTEVGKFLLSTTFQSIF